MANKQHNTNYYARRTIFIIVIKSFQRDTINPRTLFRIMYTDRIE